MFKTIIQLQHINEKGTRGRKHQFNDRNPKFRVRGDMGGIVKDLSVHDMKLIRKGIETLTEIIILYEKDENDNRKNITKQYLPLFIDKIEFWTGNLKLPDKEHRTDTKQHETVTKYYRTHGVKQV